MNSTEFKEQAERGRVYSLSVNPSSNLGTIYLASLMNEFKYKNLEDQEIELIDTSLKKIYFIFLEHKFDLIKMIYKNKTYFLPRDRDNIYIFKSNF